MTTTIELSQLRFYLDTIFSGKAPGEKFLIWTLPDKLSFWFGSVDDAVLALEQDKDGLFAGRNLFAQFCPEDKDYGPHKRGEEKDVVAMPGLFADIDIAEEGHKGKSYPPSIEDVMMVLADYPKPSMIVSTGHGIHAYWMFTERFVTLRDVDRAAAKELLSRWQAWIRSGMEKQGWTIDHTADLARVLRIPGTWNLKDPEHPLQATFEEELK